MVAGLADDQAIPMDIRLVRTVHTSRSAACALETIVTGRRDQHTGALVSFRMTTPDDRL
jgi:hypothetical protein